MGVTVSATPWEDQETYERYREAVLDLFSRAPHTWDVTWAPEKTSCNWPTWRRTTLPGALRASIVSRTPAVSRTSAPKVKSGTVIGARPGNASHAPGRGPCRKTAR